MSKVVPEDIISSIHHFSERAKASIKVDLLLDELRGLEKIDFDDLQNVEKRAVAYIELAEVRYQAGLLSEHEYIFHQYRSVVSLIHETRWLQGRYSKELELISEKMREIEKSYGLTTDEYWAKGDAPLEHQILNEEYEKVLDSILEKEFLEFASAKVADLFSGDKDKLESLSEIGRKSIFIKNDIQRLNELAMLYEQESEKNESCGAFFSASIMLAAAIEARLIIQCIKNRDEVRESLRKMGLTNSKLKSKNPLDWKLNTLIEVSANSGWLPNVETQDFVFNSKNIGHTLRNTRNLVHPGMHVKRKAALALGKEQFKDIKAAYLLVSKLLEWPNNKIQPTANAAAE